MRIYLPHLHYTVHVKERESFKGKTDFIAVCVRDDDRNSTIYIKKPIKKWAHGTLVHEVIHALQFICESRNIDFLQEQEHVGYLAQYIFNKITGHSYI